MLRKHNVPVPEHIIISRDRERPGEYGPAALLEDEHSITVDGVTLRKPFVEKPVSPKVALLPLRFLS